MQRNKQKIVLFLVFFLFFFTAFFHHLLLFTVFSLSLFSAIIFSFPWQLTYSDINQDPSNFFYLHPSDQANNKLISTIFNGTNYNNWKRANVIAISPKNKIGFWMEQLLNHLLQQTPIKHGKVATISFLDGLWHLQISILDKVFFTTKLLQHFERLRRKIQSSFTYTSLLHSRTNGMCRQRI